MAQATVITSAEWYRYCFKKGMLKKILLLFILGLSSWSADLHLFNDNSSFNDEFSKSIFSKSLKKDERIFLDNKSLIFKEVLGSGNTTLILKVIDPETNKELALRLPHGNEESGFYIFDAKRFINLSFEGYQELKDLNLEIPTIHFYKKDSYLLVDLIDHDYTLKSFIESSEQINESIKTKAVNSLLEFSKKSAIFESIGDFHLEQIVYSKAKNKWVLLDWTESHQIARVPSSPTVFKQHHFFENNRSISEFGRDLLSRLKNTIEEERTIMAGVDDVDFDSIKLELNELSKKEDIINIYKKIKNTHLGTFYIQLQKDFIDNQIKKFSAEKLKKIELKLLLDHLGKFSSYYFSQLTEKILPNINDLETFMLLYSRINTIGLDEDLEDDIAIAISKNIERILSNTENTPQVQKDIELLKDNFTIINYRTREFIGNANEYLRTKGSCRDVISAFL